MSRKNASLSAQRCVARKILPVAYYPSVIRLNCLLGLVKDICQVASTTILTVLHGGHEDTSTALGGWALTSQAFDLSITINLVVLEHSQFGLLALVLDLLGGGVDLLLALLGATTKTKDQMQGRLLLDVVVRQGSAVLELLAGEDQTLLVRWDAFLV